MTLLAILFSISVDVTVFIVVIRFIKWLCKEPCKHESFIMDKQIRVVECTQCGMRAWVEKDHVDLFAPGLTAKWMRDKIQGGNQ